jgi:hypothetical protein
MSALAQDHLAVRSRLLLVLGLMAINGALYLLTNAHPLHPPVLLPSNVVDLALGWHAWTIWPYWLLLALAPAMAVGLRDRWIAGATLRAYALALGLNLAAWTIWPTRILRSALPQGLDPATDAAWQLLYALDAPNNCFPSGHVTLPLVIAVGFGLQYPRTRRWLWPPLLLLLPTVVTTGQHYSWDILGGATTAVMGWVVAGRNPRNPGSQAPTPLSPGACGTAGSPPSSSPR